MSKQGQKLTDELKEQIRLHLVLSGNISETSRKFDVSKSTVSKIRDEEPDDFEQLRTDKKNLMIDRIWGDMELALDLGNQKIRLAKAASENFEGLMENLTDALKDGGAKFNEVMEVMNQVTSVMTIPLGQISTYFGTLYDKRALMKGENTSNLGMTGTLNHRHVSDLSDEDLEKIANGGT